MAENSQKKVLVPDCKPAPKIIKDYASLLGKVL